MELYDLAQFINDSAMVDIYSAETREIVATYDGKDSIPDELMERDVSDIFVDGNHLCVEIEMEDE